MGIDPKKQTFTQFCSITILREHLITILKSHQLLPFPCIERPHKVPQFEGIENYSNSFNIQEYNNEKLEKNTSHVQDAFHSKLYAKNLKRKEGYQKSVIKKELG